MKRVVRYLLEGNGTVPLFVEDGGYFPVGEELVGISVDDTKRHLPNSVHILTKQNLIDRLVAIEYKNIPTDTEPMSQSEIESFVDQWLSDKGLPEYS